VVHGRWSRIDAAAYADHNRHLTAVRRIVFTLLAIAAIAANVATRPAAPASVRAHAAHGCQAAAPGGKAATIEAAGVAIAVQHTLAAQGISTRTRGLPVSLARASAVLPVFAFARPHDPRHLHTFSLLI
jgi:hypothetical protein